VSPAARRGPGWLVPAALVLVGTVAIVAFARDEGSSEPLDPRSHGRLGTSAFVAMARDLGAEARVTDELPGDDADVYVVLRDFFDERQRDVLDDWVDRGGTAVVVDPGSELTPPTVASAFALDDAGLDVSGACEVDALAGIDTGGIEPQEGVLYEVPGAAEPCVGDDFGAYIVAIPRGQGTVVAVGGSGMFVNEALGDGENAAVVAALVAPDPGTRLEVLRPGPPAGTGERGLLDLVAPNVWAFLAQLVVAFVLLVLWRSRRLGAPVVEPQPVAVAGSELVAAVGSLLDRSGSPQHAADVIIADLRRFLGDRLGLPTDAPADVIAAVAAERVGLDRGRVAQALDPGPVEDDAQLVDLAHRIDSIREEVLDHV
jgi:hypothetical protein